LTTLRVTVGNIGPWFAECDLEDATVIGTAATIRVGALRFVGTVLTEQSGTFGLQRLVRVCGGAGGWGKAIDAHAYHNDAGVKARLVAEDAARAAGETLGTFVPKAERLGNDYARQQGPASRALLDAVGDGVAWWVDYAGVTRCGPRPSVVTPTSAYEVLAYDPRSRMATLGTDDPASIVIGSLLTERLDAPGTVRELELTIDAGELRMSVWLGGSQLEYGRLSGLMRSIAQQATSEALYGSYRYRVIRMAADGRAELQAVRAAAGLPDIAPIAPWPGIAGVHAELTPGAEVLVTFIEGDRAQPVITSFAGRGGVGFVPVGLVLGGVDGPPAARQNDAVQVLLPPLIFSGTIGGTPASGVLTSPLVTTMGSISVGSAKVKVA
jgi:hypothetical protein